MSSSPATVADVKRIPDFAQVDDALVTSYLTDALAISGGPDGWGELFSMAHRYLAQHLMAIDGVGEGSSSANGPIIAETVGPVSRKYAVPAFSKNLEADDSFNATRFGRMYLQLARQVGTRVLAT